ncbi:MAG: Hpt domain-containing protein [Candidatus Competibacter denitrificans]|jgi:HPt (histidine-containing phosphotransfer) domain-containing protein
MVLSVFDFDHLLTQTGGDLAFAHETLSKFRNQLHTGYQAPLQSAWERQDWLLLRQLSHRLRTPANHLGAQRIAAAAAAMEQWLIQHEDLSLTLYEALTRSIDEFLVDAR